MKWLWLGFLVLLPVGVRLGLPSLIKEAAQFHPFGLGQTPVPPLDAVESVGHGQLTVQTPTGATEQWALAGLATVNDRWQQEETGVIAALLQSSPQVRITPQSKTTALVQLSNGTWLQRILLSDGVSKLDPQQMATLPAGVALELQHAQASAQQQHKNVWETIHESPQ